MRRILLLAGLVLVLGACSRGYERENRSIVAELPAISDVVLIDEYHYRYCSGDTCLFGDDRSAARLVYSVDVDEFTMLTVAEAYRDGLPEWESAIEQGCANADPSFCDETVFASFARGDERIDLLFSNWPIGQFEVYIDAKGGPGDLVNIGG